MRSIPGIILFCLLIQTAYSQSAIEALRYSSEYQIGTARNIGIGGVMGSMGADLSVMSTNPAGIARYRTTEFSITPNISFGNTEGNYLGNSFTDDVVKFNLSSGGIAMAWDQNNSGGWKNISAGVGINRLDSYNDNIILTGTNTSNSVLDLHALIAEGYSPSSLSSAFPFDAGLSYLSGLIMADTNLQYTTVLGSVAPKQDITISREGGKYETFVGAGGNYNDVIYVGGSIGIPIINFSETSVIHEEDANKETGGFNYLDLRNEVRTKGYGVDFKLGLLARPHRHLRVGLAFKTPSYIRMNDQYQTFLYSDYDTVAYDAESPFGEFSYNLVLPWKMTTSLSMLLSDYGFLGFEYAFQNTGMTKFRFRSSDPDVILEEKSRNQNIDDLYGWQHFIRTGVEIKLDPIRLRAGFQAITPALADGMTRFIYSGGLGYRGEHFFVDAAYSFSKQSENYIPYELGNVTSGKAVLDHKQSQFTITIGAKL